VVVTIIAVLVGILLPALGEARKAGGRASCASNLRQIGLSFDLYQNDYSDMYPCANDPFIYANSWWLWMGRGFRAVLEPYIAPNLNEKNPNILWCPQDTAPSSKYESTSYAYSMSFYHSPAQINQMTDTTFTYSAAKKMPGVAIQSGNISMPSRKILAGEWTSNHKLVTQGTDPGWWGWAGERNFLLADGHVEYLPTQKIKPANDKLPDPNLTVDGVDGRDL